MLNLKKTVKALVLSSIAFLGSCNSDDTESNNQFKVTTNEPIITGTQGTFGGNVVSDGGNSVTDRGVVIGPNTNPVITDETNNFVGHIGSGTGTFSETYDLSSAPSGVYYYRAFAVNSTGVIYGEEKIINYGISTSCNTIIVNSNINTPTTWIVGNVYVIDTYLTVNSVLTIQPGVVVKFKTGKDMTISSSGTLVANGTDTERIVFTSYLDDSYCGDTNEDSSATIPQKGDWVKILIQSTGNSLTFCDILYAGANNSSANNAIQVGNGSGFTIDNCVFAHTKTGMSFRSAALYGDADIEDNTSQIITNNAFYDNDIPLFVAAKYSVSPTNIFHNPTNPSQTNTRNIIVIETTYSINNTVLWNVTEVPYVPQSTMVVNSPATLIIGANAIVKFTSQNHGLERQNANNITFDGTSIFTSYKDDTVGGDSNGDGNLTNPVIGDWKGIRNNWNGTYASGSNIRYSSY